MQRAGTVLLCGWHKMGESPKMRPLIGCHLFGGTEASDGLTKMPVRISHAFEHSSINPNFDLIAQSVFAFFLTLQIISNNSY